MTDTRVLGAIALLPLCLLAACGGGSRRASAQFQDARPVETLYNRGTAALDRKLYAEAATAFEEVERQHPFSEWARRSMIMSAYANYKANKYEEAIAAADRFIGLHPGNKDAPYAYYLIAQSWFDQILDVGRDQATSANALQSLTEVVKRFPDSEYALDARVKMDMVRDQLGGKDMEVGRFYLRQRQYIAAINRFRNVIDRYQTTSHAPEALHRMVEAYTSLGLMEEAKRTAAVLGYNYPGTVWYEDTYRIMVQAGVVDRDFATNAVRPADVPAESGRTASSGPVTDAPGDAVPAPQ